MRIIIAITSAALLFFYFLQTGCTSVTTSARSIDSITIKDSLKLRGSCVITGRIVDNDTDEPIRGANIVVYSKPKSTVTDLYGQFDLIDIPPGTYTLQVFCVGYSQKEFSNIKVKPDRMIKLDIRLEPRKVNIK